MNTFKFLSLLAAVYGLQAQAQNYDGSSSYGGLYQYYQGQSQGQSQDQQSEGYTQSYGQAPGYGQSYGQNYGQTYGQQQYDQNYGQAPSNPYADTFQYYQRQQGQQSQAPSNSYGSAYGSADPYGFDAQDPTMPSRRGSNSQYGDQYGQYGTPNPPTGPYQGPQTTPDTRSQRAPRDGYGYQDPQDSMGSGEDDSQQIRQHPHRGQIGSRKSQSDMDSDSFGQDQKKSCDSKLNDTQKKALIDIVEKSVGSDDGKISDALKSKKITLLGSSVKQQGSAVDCKFQSQVTILFKSNNALTCTVKATASIDSTGKTAFGKEQDFSCGDESRETNVRTGVELYKTNFEKPAAAPSKGGRA